MRIDTLNQVFSTYEVLKDSMLVTGRTIDKSIQNLHNKTIFFGEQEDDIRNKMSFVSAELDDIMILSLFASFERELRVFMQDILNLDATRTNPLIIKSIEVIVERLAIKDMVDTFIDVVNENIRSKVIQIYEYRNWVAHGKNPNRLPSIRTDPKTVFTTLYDFILQASSVLLNNEIK
jgi:hypothetical protein